MQTPELKPCPFCGGEAYIADLRNGQFVTCKHKDSCRVKPDTWPYSGALIERQIEVWNRRAYADADPVRHGRWVDDDCSVCGFPIPTDDRFDAIFEEEVKYCYHCGAKMDAKGN